MEIIAETMKLIGNSLYGRCVMNKEKHVGMTYANDSNITKKLMIHILKTLIKFQIILLKFFQAKEKLKWMFLFKLVVLFMI